MDTTRKFTWTPDGYALNAASGELVPVDVPEIKSVRSIFSAVNSLAFDFEKKMLAMIMPSIRHCHPLGFLGVSSARRRRERVQVWAALSVETTICRFLNYAVRVLEGKALITLLRVFTILCLRRGTILLQLGCIETLSMRIVGMPRLPRLLVFSCGVSKFRVQSRQTGERATLMSARQG